MKQEKKELPVAVVMALVFQTSGCTLSRSLDYLDNGPASPSSRTIPGCSGPGWCDLQHTEMHPACPPKTAVFDYNYNCPAILKGRNSGIADTRRGRLLFWGGNESLTTGYYGNELYALDLAKATLARLDDPSPLDPSAKGCATDGRPSARVTFDTMVYIEPQDKMFVFGGTSACDGINTDTWTLDLESLHWTNMLPSGGPPEAQVGSVADYDPNTGLVFLNTARSLWKYDLDQQLYTLLVDAPIPLGSVGRVDPKRKLFVVLGAGQARAYDIDAKGQYAVFPWTGQLTGCDPVVQASFPGLAYDPDIDRMVGWPNQGNDIYILDVSTKTCTKQSFVGAPPLAVGGMLGRWRYFPDFGVFTVIDNVDQDAYVLRLE